MQTKANAAFFPPGLMTANGVLQLTVGEQQIRVNDTPWLLGVILDHSLSFNAHVKHIKQSLSSRLQAITVAVQHMLPGVGGNPYYELLSMPWSAPS